MALSNAERQRRHYERRKAAARARSDAAELTRPFLRQPFFAYLHFDSNWEDAEIALRMAGIEPPEFGDDSGPNFPSDLDGLELPTHLTDSIGRAELAVECLLDAATTLAGIINSYKRKELNDTLLELEQTGLHDLFIRSKADTDTFRIRKILGRLDKQVRWTLPEWKVKGE